MTAETYLDQIKKIDFMIKNKLQEYQRWVEAAEDIGGAAIGERVQSSRNLHRGADAIGKYIDIEQEIEALKRQRQHIIETIEKLPSTEYDLIHKMYVQDYTMKELAYHFGKSYAWVKCKKSNGLKLLQDILDERRAVGCENRAN
jgi:DNA-directed RNA polymerase specialized sigma24 family protein